MTVDTVLEYDKSEKREVIAICNEMITGVDGKSARVRKSRNHFKFVIEYVNVVPPTYPFVRDDKSRRVREDSPPGSLLRQKKLLSIVH